MREPLPEGITEGTVSHGTLRTVDLISMFATELTKLAPELALLTGNRAEIDLAHQMSGTRSDYEYVEAVGNGSTSKGYEVTGWLIDELLDALNTHSPDGWYFGNSEGDGSDFGWWRIEDTNDDLGIISEENHIFTWQEEDLIGFKLYLYDGGRTGEFGRTYLGYQFVMKGEAIFEGDDFGVPTGKVIDSLEVAASLLHFLSLRPGDTDADYFDDYTERQWQFVEEHAEDLSMLVSEIEEHRVRSCDDCGLIQHHESSEGADWPHGLCGRCALPDWDHPWIEDWQFLVANGDTLHGLKEYVSERRKDELLP